MNPVCFPWLVPHDTPVITLTAEGISTTNLEDDDAAAYTTKGNLKSLTIQKIGIEGGIWLNNGRCYGDGIQGERVNISGTGLISLLPPP